MRPQIAATLLLAATVTAQSTDTRLEIPTPAGVGNPETNLPGLTAPIAVSSAVNTAISSAVGSAASSAVDSVISAAVSSAVDAASAAASTYSLPDGSTLSNGGYVCNPAHYYGTGMSCDTSGATPTLITSAGSATAAATSAYPAGSTLSNGGYVCNPAHSYPAGQSCDSSGSTPTLVMMSAGSTATGSSGSSWNNTWSSASGYNPVATWVGGADARQVSKLGAFVLGLVALVF